MQLFVNGRFDPLADAVYNLHVTAQLGLNRVREIFAINKVLDGVDRARHQPARQGAARSR